MQEKIKWVINEMIPSQDKNLHIMDLSNIQKARTFHESFPQYTLTPLYQLEKMAAYLGLKELYLKEIGRAHV